MITELIELSLPVRLAIYVMVGLVLHWPGNWFVRMVLKRWRPDQGPTDRMGGVLGTLERTLILVLVGLQAYTAVGFVVTMKSIARYEKVQKERAFAEYFLAGTMLSMLLALVLGLLVRMLVGDLTTT